MLDNRGVKFSHRPMLRCEREVQRETTLIYCFAQLRSVQLNIRLIWGEAVTAVFAASPSFQERRRAKQSGKIRSKFKHDLATIRLTITCVWTRRFDSRHHRLWGWMEDRKHVSALKKNKKKPVQIYFLRSKFFCKTKPVISLLIRSCTILQNIVWEALR